MSALRSTFPRRQYRLSCRRAIVKSQPRRSLADESGRSVRRQRHASALHELESHRGTQFDPDITDALLDMIVSQELGQMFASRNGIFNAWPFFREFVQSTVARMGMPPLMIPLFKRPPLPTK